MQCFVFTNYAVKHFSQLNRIHMEKHLNKLLKSLILLSAVFFLHSTQMIAQDTQQKKDMKIRIQESKKMDDGTIVTSESEKSGKFTEAELEEIVAAGKKESSVKQRSVSAKITNPDGTVEQRNYNWESKPSYNVMSKAYGEELGDDIVIRLEELEGLSKEKMEELQEKLKNLEIEMPELNITIDEMIPRINWEDIYAEGAPNFKVSKRPFLGVYTESNDGKGVRITRIVEDSPAAATGLMKDDVLTEVDGNPVNSPDELTKFLGDKEVDQEVMLTIIRNGNSMKQAVKLGTRKYEFGFMDMNEVERMRGARVPRSPNPRVEVYPDARGGNQDGWFNKNKNKGARLGVTIQEMENYDGLKVIGIESNSLAERNGILLHDVIVKFDGKKVNDTKTLQSLVKDNVGEDVTIELKRNKKKKKLTFRIE